MSTIVHDKEYKDKVVKYNLEGCDWDCLVCRDVAPVNHSILIGNLQYIHDKSNPKHWHHDLNDLADSYNLNKKVLKKFKK